MSIVLKNWSFVSAPHYPTRFDPFIHVNEKDKWIRGQVYNHPNYSDGTWICTSLIISEFNEWDKKQVETITGSIYYLDGIHKEYIAFLNNGTVIRQQLY